MFPSLTLTLQGMPVVLQGRDYVRRDGIMCSPQLDCHALAFNDNVIVLGAVFLRAYYTVFDVSTRQVGFACAGPQGACTSGHRLHELQFVAANQQMVAWMYWHSVYTSFGAMLVIVGGVMMWMTASHEKKVTLILQRSNQSERVRAMTPKDEDQPEQEEAISTTDTRVLDALRKPGISFRKASISLDV
jgi:Eukaryotic aspartyl protease